MAFEQVTLSKNGVDKIAYSPSQLVALKFDGYTPKTAKDAKTAQSNVAPFNPDDHTAAEVAEYIAGASETEAQRVRDAEAAGKNRSTALA